MAGKGNPACAPTSELTRGKKPAISTIQVANLVGTDLAFGSRAPKARFDEVIELVDSHGRFQHLLGFIVRFVVQVDTVAANMTAAMSGRLLAGLMTNVQCTALGRQLFKAGVDGRDLLDKQLLTAFSALPAADDIPDADATDLLRTVTIPFFFGNAQSKNKYRRDVRDGAIPMSAFQSRMRGKDLLEWNWATAIPTAPAGVTLNSINSCTVDAVILASEKPIREPLIFLDTLASADGQMTIERTFRDEAGAIQAAAIRFQEEMTGGLITTDISNVTVRVGGETLASNETAAERLNAALDLLALDPVLARSSLAAGNFVSFVPLVMSPPETKRSDMADGPILLDVDTLGGHTAGLRVVTVSYTATPESWWRAALKGFGVDPDSPDNETVFDKVSPGSPVADVAASLVTQVVQRKGG